ncbi:MAG: hypothetical protein WBC92_16290 [Terracidiphilus sp.]
MSSRLGWGATILSITSALALPAAAQYQGQVSTNKNTPQLRAVGVLEWTGDEDHPKTSRLIPICVYDGQDLQDASIYLSQPEPLALQSEVEYQLLQDGKPVGFFDISSAAQQQGSWIGLGKWKALPRPKPARVQLAKVDEDDAQSDEPVLHRKHHASDSGSGSSSGSSEPAPDPDRPTLHKGPDASSGNSGDSSTTTTDSNAPPPDPNRPILRPDTDSSSAGSASSTDSGRPKLKKKSDNDDGGYVSDVATLTDPDRPHLFRGKAEGYGAPVLPTFVGLPADMHQQVAVSDVTSRPIHIWNYSWANPGDEAKMKADMEDIARTALGLNPPPAPAKPASRRSTTARRTAKPAPPPPPAPLADEQFHVFELAYGSGATMVLSAHTAVAGEQEKFVTLIGQPDLYGNVAILLKNVTDASRLDSTPRMRLVDAVDAMADNRGELLFELRGATQRQFALYRVLRGDASRIFLSSTEPIATTASN